MNEFNNRIIAQRNTLRAINGKRLYSEPLFSLTEKAIDRWVSNNKIDQAESFVALVREVSKKLFFLANKSQEQMTEDYRNISMDVDRLIEKIEMRLNNYRKAQKL